MAEQSLTRTEELQWYEQQELLSQLMQSTELPSLAAGLRLFLAQHVQLHFTDGRQSLADSALAGLSEQQWRLKPNANTNPIAWLIWHMARIEDVTFHLLVIERTQVFDEWFGQLTIGRRDVGTGMNTEEAVALSDTISLPALRAYWRAVGQRTQQAAQLLEPTILKERAKPESIQRLFAEGMVTPQSAELAQWWAERTKGELLVQPVSRHAFWHLHEIQQIREMLCYDQT